MLPAVTIVVGKGGVGRSTVAQGFALAASMIGQRAAYVQLDLAGEKQTGKNASATNTERSALLTWITVDGSKAIETVAAPLFGSPRIARSVIGNFAIQRLLDVVPSIREYASIAAALELSKQFDRVIIDMPATGHGAAWLGVAGRLATLVPAGQTREQAERVQAALRDPQQTRIVAVTLTEPLVLVETRELRNTLIAELGRDIDHMVINRAPAALSGSRTAAEQLATSASAVALQAKELATWIGRRETARAHGANEAKGVDVTWIEQYPSAPAPAAIAATLGTMKPVVTSRAESSDWLNATLP
jgi:arsenite/tail-anchored protein-transporting ATPase